MSESVRCGEWPIFVISLPRAASRRDACRAALDRIGAAFEFFDAIDGVALSDAQVAAVYDEAANARGFKRPLSRPEVGCYLSHLTLWRRIVEGGYPGAVILEDDFDADESFPAVVRNVSRIAPPGCVVKLHAAKSVVGDRVASLPEGRRLVFPDSVQALMTGYMLDAEAARVLAAAAPFWRPVDLDLKFWWKNGVAVLQVDPPVVHIGPHGDDSFIESSRQSIKFKGLIGGFLRFSRNLRYQIGYRVELRNARRLRRDLLRRLSETLSSSGRID